MVVVWLLCAVPISAKADVIIDSKAIVEAVKAKRDGAWFDKAAMGKCLEAVELVDNYRATVAALEAKVKSLESSLELTREQLILAGNAARKWEERYHLEHGMVLSLQAELGAWYRNPLIVVPSTLLLGGVLGGGVGLLAGERLP